MNPTLCDSLQQWNQRTTMSTELHLGTKRFFGPAHLDVVFSIKPNVRFATVGRLPSLDTSVVRISDRSLHSAPVWAIPPHFTLLFQDKKKSACAPFRATTLRPLYESIPGGKHSIRIITSAACHGPRTLHIPWCPAGMTSDEGSHSWHADVSNLSTGSNHISLHLATSRRGTWLKGCQDAEECQETSITSYTG